MTTTSLRSHGYSSLRSAIGIVLAVLFIGVPGWLVIITAAKTSGDAQSPNLTLPETWNVVENFVYVFQQGQVLSGLVSTLAVVVPSVVGVLTLGAMASWVFGRRTGRRAGATYAVLVSGILLPPAIVTTVYLLRALALDETRIGLIAVYLGVFLSTAVFFMTGFIRTIPAELEDAARIDGAKPYQIFWRVIFPLLLPVIATAAILITLFAWNDIFYSFFILGGNDAPTLPLNLYRVSAEQLYINNWNYIFAYVITMSLPLVGIFLLGQRWIVAGLTGGAVK